MAGYETYARQLGRLFHDNRELLTDVMDGLFHIAVADGSASIRTRSTSWPTSPRSSGSRTRNIWRIKGRHFRCDLYDPYNILHASPKATGRRA